MEQKKENRVRIVGLRLTPDEYGELEKKWRGTTLKKLSEYVRRIIFSKAVTVNTRDRSVDEMLRELALLRRELSAIGNNFNQAVHRLHTLDHSPQMQAWLAVFERDKSMLFDKIGAIGERINLMADKWLP